MGKLAVIGDCHGNYPALKTVLTVAEKLGCDHYLCCGDYMGYYYQADQVIDLIKALPHTAILGNHDRDFLRLLDREWRMTDDYRKEYGSSLERALKSLKKENVRWLRSLSPRLETTIEGSRILLCHGSPWDINEYLYPDMPGPKLGQVYALGFDLVIMGHCHYQYVKENGKQTVLNPGAVGQARDKSGAAWALITMKANDIGVELIRTVYDVDEVAAQARSFDPEVKYLSEVLKRGRNGV